MTTKSTYDTIPSPPSGPVQPDWRLLAYNLADRALGLAERLVKVQEERIRLTEKMLDQKDQQVAEAHAAISSLTKFATGGLR